MKSVHRASIGAAALVGIITASSASPPPLLARVRSVEPQGAQLMAFGGRTYAQLHSSEAKLDAALADLARHANLARPGRVLADLHAMSPAARFTQSGTMPMVAVDAVTRGDPQRLADALIVVGLKHPVIYRNDVGGWLPVSAITAAAARAEVVSLRAAMPHTRGAVATQGDFAIGGETLSSSYPSLTGTGVTVGVLSDSFDCYGVYAADKGEPGDPPVSGPNGWASNGFTADAAADVADGALPPAADIDILEEAGGSFGTAGSQGCLNFGAPLELPFSDEGRAIMQIVHAVAPGANLAFYTADNSEADFANGITALATAGAKVEADDVGYYDEPFFQDGIVAQAIDAVEAKGVAYFSAAGNNSNLAYDNNSPQFTTTKTTLADGSQENLLVFGTSGGSNVTSLPVTIQALVPGEFIAVVLEWNQPYVTGAPGSPGASSEIDLCVTGTSAATTVVNLDGNAQTCTGHNATGTDPVQILIIGNSAAATSNTSQQTINLIIGLYGGTTPTMIKLAVEDGGAGSTIDAAYATNSATLQGHPSATGAAAVGAAAFYSTPDCGTAPAQLEYFSALGGAQILFNTSGEAITPETRQKPDFVGPDGVNDTFLGFQIPAGIDNSNVAQCANNASYPNFYGTSAATPHAAGVAALMLQANPSLTPAQIYANLRNSALAMGTVPNPGAGVYNFSDGYGFMQADAAMALLPVLSITTTSLASGQVGMAYSATLAATGGIAPYTWSVAGGTLPAGLTLASNGTISGTPTAATSASSVTFMVSDSRSPADTKTVMLSMTIADSSSSGGGGGGGGGGLGGTTLLALAGFVLARLLRAAPALAPRSSALERGKPREQRRTAG